jgi:molybdopterin synthase sulfur carrier subunit
MKVEVRLYATLRRYVPDLPLGHALALDLPPGAIVAQVLEQMGVPAGEVKVVMVNNRRVELDAALAEDDHIGVFPPVAGG